MKKPFFSIIIPTLNEESFLPNLLHTLTAQSFLDFEVIVVDGNSADATLDVAAQFYKDLPKLSLYSVSKQNVSYQRNFGAGKARGEYLVFFDADVMVNPQFLSKVCHTIHKRNSSLLTTWVVPDSGDPVDRIFSELGNMYLSAARMLGMQFAGGFNLIVKRHAFDAVGGFREDVVHAEDHDFVRRLGEIGFSLDVLPSPRLIYSFRRFRTEGRLKVVGKYTYSSLHLLFKGSITNDIFSYQMGGQYYNVKYQVPNVKTKPLRLRHVLNGQIKLKSMTQNSIENLETVLLKSFERTKIEATKLFNFLVE